MHNSDPLLLRKLLPILNVLESGGYYLETGTDMSRFSARLIGRNRHVYPGFRRIYEPDNPGTYGAILNHRDELICCMAWRCFETTDLLSNIEDFLPMYCDHDEAMPRWTTDLTGILNLSGTIGYRGGLHSMDEGNFISWFMTSIAMICLDHAGVDIQAGEAREEMIRSGRFRTMSGYGNANPLGTIFIRKHGHDEALNLVWSTAKQVTKEIDVRLKILSDCDPKNFKAAVATLQSLK